MKIPRWTICLLVAAPTLAQAPSSASPQTLKKTPSAQADFNSPRQPETQLEELNNRTKKLELEMSQKADKTSADARAIPVATAIIAAAAVLGAGLLGIAGQYFMSKREDRRSLASATRALELARQEAIFEHTQKILEFRLKQMERFYAPMFALRGQSRGLYDKMLYQLAQDEPQRYRFPPKPDQQDYRLQVIDKAGEWRGFRLLDQLPAVKRNPKAFALAERILEIGDRMTKIISAHAGLASEDLVPLLGQYMAHYAILSTVHTLGETEPYEPGWHKMGYYPRELDAKIEESYRELSRFFDEYAAASKRMLQNFLVTNTTE